jgi:putative flippase GtrA
MHKIIEAGQKLAEQRFVRYVIVGGTTFALDFFLLVFLHGALGVDLLIAATISYWSSIGFNFWVNRIWTFGATDSGVAKHLTFYLTLLACNYGFSIAFIAAGTSLGMHFTIAKILATGFQTIWTYIAYKRFIFK